MLAVRMALSVFTVLLVTGCGGGGGGNSTTSPIVSTNSSSSSSVSYVAGVYAAASGLQNQCAVPRGGIDPYTNKAYPDRPGSTLAEQLWLRSWTNDYYLWYREVPDTNPTGYTTAAYFDLLKTSAITASGKKKDQFHFTYDTAQWEALSQSNSDLGYGIEWIVRSGTPPRDVVVAYVHPNSPAALLGVPVKRGEVVISVDGVTIDSGTPALLNEGLFPTNTTAHSIGLRDPSTNTSRVVNLQPTVVTLASVQNVKVIATSNGNVGYLQFNDHLASSELALRDAINTFKSQSIADLVIDMRYNGGGYLAIASELGYMIAGNTTTNRVFQQTQFNDKYSTINPFTGSANTSTPFYTTASGNFSLNSGTVLPTLNLSQVYVLTGKNTCSASEALVSGLKGIGISVVQIGATTCGKPYGFYSQDNCGVTYFSIQFQGVNAMGQGGYSDGFAPINSVQSVSNDKLPGCSVADDFTHALGDPLEGRLAAALNYRQTGGMCPTSPTSEPSSLGKAVMSINNAGEGEALNEGTMLRSPLRENAWY